MIDRCKKCKYNRYLIDGECSECNKERHDIRRRIGYKAKKADLKAVGAEPAMFSRTYVKKSISDYYEAQQHWTPTSFFAGLCAGLSFPSKVSIKET